MKHLLLVACAATAFVVAPARSHAGGYIGLGIGTNAKLHGDFVQHFDSTDATSLRFTLGKRTGPLAIEGTIFGTELRSITGRITSPELSAVTAEVGLKYHFELSGRLEAYVRAGLNHTWLVEDNQDFMAEDALSGNGYSGSVGLQYNLSALLGTAAVWLDYTHAQTTLTQFERADLSGGTRTLSIGLSVGF